MDEVVATEEQLAVAKQFHIPKAQAHTINMAKVEAYRAYLAGPVGSTEKFLDELEERRLSMQ